MPCVNADGTLTEVADRVLRAAASRGGVVSDADVAAAAGVPLYRARASLRELAAAGLVGAEGTSYRLAPAGEKLLHATEVEPRTG